jgi:hypothetical protein
MTTTADGRGCYELKDLPIGSYRVTVRLPGFDNATRDGVTIAARSVERLDFSMRPSGICECVRMSWSTLAEQWDYADAVLDVRLRASEPQPRTQGGYYRHAATVLNALKKPTGSLQNPVIVIQNQTSAAPGPYDIDQELVMFLRSSGSGEFVITNDNPGLVVPRGSDDPAIVFLVQDGHIQRAPSDFSRYVGMPVDAFLKELRALSRNK